MTTELDDLLQRIAGATGADSELDREIADRLERADRPNPVPDYTASVDSCLGLIGRILPGWHWHIGFGPRGIFPYATLQDGEDLFEAMAPTVPLALLHAVGQARRAIGRRAKGRPKPSAG
ncbi:MAG: hypothetical protein QNJ30_00155 [Kiloniellales bacterium]|nr:hypothetical protein [Kiloniellales bacterium]